MLGGEGENLSLFKPYDLAVTYFWKSTLMKTHRSNAYWASSLRYPHPSNKYLHAYYIPGIMLQ